MASHEWDERVVCWVQGLCWRGAKEKKTEECDGVHHC